MSTASPIITLSPAWGIYKTLRYNTIAQITTAQQGSVYVAGALAPIWDFKFAIPLMLGRMDDPTSEIAKLMGLFALCQGRAGTFLFPDPRDNTVTNYQFATGDGTSQVFQLTRPLGAASIIVQNVNGVPSISVGGTVTTLYNMDNKGVITFNTAPASGAAITWSGQFLFRLRFSEDTLSDMQLFFENSWSVNTIQLESVNI